MQWLLHFAHHRFWWKFSIYLDWLELQEVLWNLLMLVNFAKHRFIVNINVYRMHHTVASKETDHGCSWPFPKVHPQGGAWTLSAQQPAESCGSGARESRKQPWCIGEAGWATQPTKRACSQSTRSSEFLQSSCLAWLWTLDSSCDWSATSARTWPMDTRPLSAADGGCLVEQPTCRWLQPDPYPWWKFFGGCIPASAISDQAREFWWSALFSWPWGMAHPKFSHGNGALCFTSARWVLCFPGMATSFCDAFSRWRRALVIGF